MNENSISNWKTIVDKPVNGNSLGRIDQYELIRELGGGGFGTVFLARDTESEVDVAVKGLPPFVKNNREEMENIRSNFRLVHDLHHPHIAAALVLHPAKSVSYFAEDVKQKLRILAGDTLLVMAYAPGVTLSQWRKQFPENKVPVEKAIEITRQIADALDYAHERKVVHRDIKPANAMIETDADGKVIARVLDFGLAAEIRSSMGRVSQEIHDTSGTRPYMAPEQWLGGKQGPATDQYSLAVLFHELVTGEVPFASVFSTGDPVVMMNVVGREPPEIPVDLSKAIRLTLAKALTKKMDERFASCGDFVTALKGGRTSSRTVFLARLALLGLTAGAAGVWLVRQQAGTEPKPAPVPTVPVVTNVSPLSILQEPEPPSPSTPDPVPAGPTEADVAGILKAAADQAPRLKTISDADGFDAKKKVLQRQWEQAEKDRKSRKWMLAAVAYTNYVNDCKALVRLDEERLAAQKKKAEAVRSQKAAETASAEKYAEEYWQISVSSLRDADGLFAQMMFREAERRYDSVAREFGKCLDEVNKKKEKQKQETGKRQVYQELAAVETFLEKVKAFEYRSAIQSAYDRLMEKHKAVKTALESNDLEAALEMSRDLRKPQEELESVLPQIRRYHRLKNEIETNRKNALSAEAAVYAKAVFDFAESRWNEAREASKKGAFADAVQLMSDLGTKYREAENASRKNPEYLYRRGLALQKAGKHNESFACFKQAAEKRHAAALTALGLCHLKGQGTNKNAVRAFSHFHEASKLNYARAQYFLAGCYAKAIGVEYDKESARVWMAIAKVNGNKAAGDFLAKAGWTVSLDEERAIREMLNEGKTSMELSGNLKFALEGIAEYKRKVE